MLLPYEGDGIDVRILGCEDDQPVARELAADALGLARVVPEDELTAGQLEGAARGRPVRTHKGKH